MRLFVVIDTKGCGRVLGVFDSRQQAERITLRYPAYYHLYPTALMGVVPAADPSGDCQTGPYRSPPRQPPDPDRVHVVLDTMGHFHVVGVMAERRHAETVARKSPTYRRIVDCALNRINPEVLDWVGDDEQRAFLASLMEESH